MVKRTVLNTFPVLCKSSLDQEAFDYIDPNTEEGALPEQGDAQIGPLLSYVKVPETDKRKAVQ